MKKKTLFNIVLIVFASILITSCVPGGEKFQQSTAGFWMGLWHGFISLFTFIISLFSDSVRIYEINNNGGWYDFGFIIGVSAFFGGGSKSTCGRRR